VSTDAVERRDADLLRAVHDRVLGVFRRDAPEFSGIEGLVGQLAHNEKVRGSNPLSSTECRDPGNLSSTLVHGWVASRGVV
jgi:hypothetical protein